MTVFKGTNWIKNVFAKTSGAVKTIRLGNLTARMKSVGMIDRSISRLGVYKKQWLLGAGAFGLLVSMSVGGHLYVKENMNEVYHVYVGNKEAGVVSSPKVVERFIESKYEQLEAENPNVHMVLNDKDITYKSERAFKIQGDDQAALKALEGMLTAKAVGVEIRVDGKLIGVVKDQATAESILNRIKQKFVPKQKTEGKVIALSAGGQNLADSSSTRLESAEFVENVDLRRVDTSPEAIADPDKIVKKLETGDVQPTKYIVREGDCVSCIAEKFNISKQIIYENNPWIENDMIRIGDELDLTVLQPTLSVRTVEKVVENQVIEHEMVYEKDDSLRLGQVKVIKPGKDGLKRVTFRLTKENGNLMQEELLDEVVLVKPVPGLAKKGTKIVGEGTGKFAWPVVGARLTSSFGKRWGRMHKGIDLVGNRKILASDDGKVVYAGYDEGYGNHIIIDHQNGFRTLYGHLSKLNVVEGQIVEKGEMIGQMGSTGDSTGTHLHFEIQKNGVPRNPMGYLSR